MGEGSEGGSWTEWGKVVKDPLSFVAGSTFL